MMRKIIFAVLVLTLLAAVSGCKGGYKTVPCPKFHHIAI
jgi:hypothetical protein